VSIRCRCSDPRRSCSIRAARRSPPSAPHSPSRPTSRSRSVPVRLMDVASGKVRTLVDGVVVGFWWSPDGRTIAALRVQPAGSPGASAAPSVAPSTVRRPHPRARPRRPHRPTRCTWCSSTSPAATSGPSRSCRPARASSTSFLTYFDQYGAEPPDLGARQLIRPAARGRDGRHDPRHRPVRRRPATGRARGRHRVLEPVGRYWIGTPRRTTEPCV
jgi:hypothetical protein